MKKRRLLGLTIAAMMLLQLFIPSYWAMAENTAAPGDPAAMQEGTVDADAWLEGEVLETGQGAVPLGAGLEERTLPMVIDSQVEINDIEFKVNGSDVAAGQKIKEGDTARFDLLFALKDDNGVDSSDPSYEAYEYIGGDWFDIALPNGISFVEGEKILGGGSSVAKVVISSGNARIYLSDAVNGVSGITGDFWIEGSFGKLNTGEDGTATIEFKINETVVKEFTIHFEEKPVVEPPFDGYITKAGTYDPATHQITWMIHVVPGTNPSTKPIVITDTLTDGQTVASATVNPDTSITPVIQGDAVTVTFPTGITEVQVITIVADLPAWPVGQNSISYDNAVTWTVGGEPQTGDSDTVTHSYDWIKKGSARRTEGANQYIDWTITVNPSGKLTIPAGATVTDTLPKYLEPTGVTMNGSPIADTFNPALESITDWAAAANGYTFTHNFAAQTTGTQVFVITTRIDPTYYDQQVQTGFNNTASIDWGTGTGDSDKHNVGVGTNVIRKSAVGSYDKVNHLLSWQVKVNENGINITNAVVTDTFIPTEHKLYEEADKSPVEIKINDTTDWVPVPKKVSEPTATPHYTYEENVLNVYLGDLVSNDKPLLRFKTEVINPEHYAGNFTGDYSNTAYLNGDNIPESNSSATQSVTSEVLKKASKGYNYATHEITWEIVVNQNKTVLNNAVISDVIDANQQYVSLTIDKDPFNGTTPVGKGLKVDGQTVTYTFPDTINDTYTLILTTKVKDEALHKNGDIVFNNAATLTHQTGGKTVTITSDDSETVKNTVVLKDGTSAAEVDYIDWKVLLNSNALPLTEAQVVDKLPKGLELDESTIKLTQLKLKNNATGELEADKIIPLAKDSDYTYALDAASGQWVFTVNLPEGPHAYWLEFTTDVDITKMTSSNHTFNNTVAFNGEGVYTDGENNQDSVVVKMQNFGASASGSNGSITVYKVDAKDNAPLASAVFELLDYKGRVIDTQTTDANGKIVFAPLRFRPYTVREKDAPVNYQKVTDSRTFTLINKDGQKHFETTFTNTKVAGTIELLKQDEAGQFLQGAVFGLYQDGAEIKIAQSDDQGRVAFDNVAPGIYQVKEISAPTGYLKTSEVLDVTVSSEGEEIIVSLDPETVVTNTPIPPTPTNPPGIVDPVGAIVIYKTDGQQRPLSGASFTLYDARGNSVQTAVSGADGRARFGNVALGDYTIRETAAPQGYVLSGETISVKMNSIATQTFFVVNQADEDNVHGRIEIIKLDEGDNVLPGAEFRLYDANGAYMQSAVSGQDGRVAFENLPKGNYTVVESRAPEGYVLSTERISVSVSQTETQSFTFRNERISEEAVTGSIQISKIDTGSQPLAGATFTLYNENGIAVQTAVSGQDGIARFDKLPLGRYTLQETEAPEGYELITDRLPVEVTSAQTLQFTFRNRSLTELDFDPDIPMGWQPVDDPKIPTSPGGKLPQAGAVVDTAVLVLIGAAFIVAGVVGTISARKRKRR